MTDIHKDTFTIFRESYERSATDREAYLETACRGDFELRQEVDHLLALTEQPDGVLEKPLVPLPQFEPNQFSAGGRIGRYPILGMIDHGGMGTVYRAHHPETENIVAVKVMRPDHSGDDSSRYFLNERKLLARLNHPNIATCLDADTTEDGQPYLVMEYVDGTPIDRYCKTHDLDLDQKIILGEKICNAVHFAHKQLILHRDLKPANILVTADGEPKLVDFGLGWQLDPSPPSVSTWQMTTVGFLGTLQYSSPEQIQGEGSPSTASDVYSLGVILYEILTGHYPFQKWNSSFFDLKEAICNQEPERPSNSVRSEPYDRRATEPRTAEELETARQARESSGYQPARTKLGRHLAGDLDSIILKAIRKEPEKRYGSAQGIAADLRRHRMFFPVTAHEPSFWYSARKLALRHRSTAILVLLLALVTLGSAVMFYGNWKREQRLSAAIEESRQSLERSWYVRNYMARLFEIDDPANRGDQIKARELLDGQTGYLQEATRLDEMDEEAQAGLLDQLPEDLPGLMDAIGWSYYGLGFSEEARQWLDDGFDRRVAEGREEDGDWVIALLHRSVVQDALGAAGAARDNRQRALERLRTETLDEKTLAQSLNDLAMLLLDRDELHSAADILGESLAMKKRLPGVMDAGIAIGTNNLAAALQGLGRHREAAAAFREALALKTQLYGKDAAALTRTRGNLAIALRDLGTQDTERQSALWTEAEALFRQSLTEYRELYGDEDWRTAGALTNLGQLQHLRGVSEHARENDLEAAGRNIEEGIRIFETLTGTEAKNVGILLRLRVQWLQTMGRAQEANEEATRSLRILETSLGEDHWRSALARNVLGGCLIDLGRFDEAEALLVESLPLIEKTKGDSSRVTVEARQRLERLRRARAQP